MVHRLRRWQPWTLDVFTGSLEGLLPNKAGADSIILFLFASDTEIIRALSMSGTDVAV